MRYLKQEKGFYSGALLLMLPMILQNFVTNLMSLADTFMVGMLGERELAAVTMANSLFFVLIFVVFGIQSGTGVLVAQYNGRGNKEAINRVLGMGYYVSVTLTAAVAVLTWLFPRQIMGVLTNNAELIDPGADYMRIVGFSYIFMSLSGVYIAVQRSMENPRLGAVVLSASGLLNILLNYILIFGKWGAPALGCAGAAIATVISRIFEAAAVLLYALRSRRLPLMPDRILRPGRVIAGDFVRFSLPVVCNEVLWSLAVSVYSVIMGHMALSTPILAAYTIAGNIDRLLNVGLFAAGSATAVIIGRDIGRRVDDDTLYGRGVALNFLCLATGLVSAGLILLTRAFLCDSFIFPVMNISDQAGRIAKYMLLIVAAAMPVRACNLCNVVGVFRGGGDVRFGLYVDVLPMYLLTVPASAVAALLLGCGIGVVYPIMCSDELFKTFMCVPHLRSRKWIHNVTRDNI